MAPNLALYVVPLAIGRTREKLDAVLDAWAAQRQQASMTVRLSGPVTIPSKDYEVWLFETPNRSLHVCLDELAVRVRAIVALRINCEVGRAIADVRERDRVHEGVRAERPEDIERVVAGALAAFEGPLDVAPGWLEPWLEAHRASAEVRCVRWHHGRTKTTEWPRGYAKPTEEEWRFFDGIHDDALNLLGADC